VQLLRPFHDPNSKVSLSAELTIRDSENLDVIFEWQDEQKIIIFSDAPKDGRFSGLWQQTCFEMFIQPVGQTSYYEINLTAQKAWNVFKFDDYRTPQPPPELPGAEMLNFKLDGHRLEAQFHLSGANLSRVKCSYCAVVVLDGIGVTYWSTKHADSKPNFHHFESFITERTRE
jgi:hypothetical protein